MKGLLTSFLLIINFATSAQGVWEYDTTWDHSYSYTKIYKHSLTGEERYHSFSQDRLVSITGMNDLGDDFDSCFYFHRNGELAAIYHFETLETFTFQLYDTLGNHYYSGEVYRGIRVGKWTELDQKGKPISWVQYMHQSNDPALTEDSLVKLKIEKYYLSDTMVYDSEYGMDWPYYGRSKSEDHQSWGIVAGGKRPDVLRAYTPFIYFGDGLGEWYPSDSPVMAVSYFRNQLKNGWDMSLYMLDSYNADIEAPEVIAEVFNYDIHKGKYAVNFWWAMYNKEDAEKATGYYDSLNYVLIEPGAEIEEDLGVYYMETKSFFMAFYFNLGNKKFKKAVAAYLPDHIALLESWADQF